MYYYFYKITNNINGKFYYGVHSTKNLDDGYMGSGIAIRKAYKKYGIENFQKQILMFFENEQAMYDYQEKIVNDQMVNYPQCYNMIIGGRSQKTFYKLSNVAKNTNQKNNYQSQKNGSRKYWTTGDIEAKKKKQSIANKKYWDSGDVTGKRKKLSERIKEAFDNRPEIREKISTKLKQFWNSEKGELKKKVMVEKLKNNPNMVLFYEKLKQKYTGYNNFDFLNRWKKVYDENADIICKFLIETDLPENFIIKILFHKKVKTHNLLAYYKTIGLLPESIKEQEKTRFLKLNNLNNKGHKDGGSKKTYYKEQIKHIMIFYEDFFKQFEWLQNVFLPNMQMSDSDINNGKFLKFCPNFYQTIQYFKQIGVVYDIQKIKIKKEKTVGDRTFLFTTTKTVFQIDYSKKQVILLDKEMNEYDYNDDGKIVCTGRFEL